MAHRYGENGLRAYDTKSNRIPYQYQSLLIVKLGALFMRSGVCKSSVSVSASASASVSGSGLATSPTLQRPTIKTARRLHYDFK
jgi:hypothetical protein